MVDLLKVHIFNAKNRRATTGFETRESAEVASLQEATHRIKTRSSPRNRAHRATLKYSECFLFRNKI
jgi:hypothetical protein